MSIAPYDSRGEIMETESSIEMTTPNASYVIVKATIDSQIATARAFRRSIKHAVNEVKSCAGLTLEIAKSCVYALPRGGKTIEGPSARFAEILASCWGNLRVQGRVIEETDRYIVVTGECIDLERNNGRCVEIRRNITDKYGKKYNADMVSMTANAAISIATRNAIFQIVPRALWHDAYEEVRRVIKGSLKPIETERTEWLAYWAGKGVSADKVFAALGVNGREEITLDHIITIEGWNNAIQAGETSMADLFPNQPAISVKATNLTAALKDVKSKPSADKPQNKPAQEQDLPWEPGANG